MGCIPLCISERREVVDMTLFGSFFILSFLVWLASPSTTERGWQARLLAFWKDAICKDGLANGRLARETLVQRRVRVL